MLSFQEYSMAAVLAATKSISFGRVNTIGNRFALRVESKKGEAIGRPRDP